MANLYAKRVKLEAKKFNKKRKLLRPKGSKAFLLQRDGPTKKLKKLRLLDNWWMSNDKYREQTRLDIATLDEDDITDIRKCSDISIDGIVYQVEARDKVAPDEKRPFWELFGTITGESYTDV